MYPYENPDLDARERAADLLSRLTLEEKLGFLSTHNLPVERLGIGEWFIGQEIARGLVNREPENHSTVFPQPIGMAATFDRSLMLEIGKTAAKEARAYFNERKNAGLMVWGPTVDLSRDPRWGRTEECYGEDPFLTGEMAGMYTKGLRGEERVWATIPTLKHFCANNHEQERASDNANLNPRLKHEFYYAAFKAPVLRGGAHSVMAAYNEICHAPAIMNHDLNEVLKKDWGLGFVVSDASDFTQNLTAHHTFSSNAQAFQACLRAGTDVMTDDDECVRAAAKKALADGLLTEADIDRAVENLLESRVLLGHFDQETPYDHLTLADVNTEADRALNLRAAREQMILLKNLDALPLDPKKHRTIGLFGPNADCNLMDWYTGYSGYQVSIRQALEERNCKVICDPGWDIVILKAPNGKYIRIGEDDCLYADADQEDASEFYSCQHDDHFRWVNFRHVESGRFLQINWENVQLGKTVVYGWFTSETLHLDRYGRQLVISDYLFGRQLCLDDNQRVVTRPKSRPDAGVLFETDCVSTGSDRISKLARQTDAVIFCGGNDPQQTARECYDRSSICLPVVQNSCLNALARVLENSGTPLIFTIVSGYPYALGALAELPDAILHSTHAGPELGHAVVDTLFGDNNPAGRCPVTWYSCDGDLPDIRDYDIMLTKMTVRWFDGTPLYPFGYGLSYSRFEYHNMQIALTDEGICVTAEISNQSDRDGDEVVQVYAHARSERIPRPVMQLCAFERMHICAGQTVSYNAVIPFRELEIYDVTRERFCLEEGEFDILLGASSRDIRMSEVVHVPGECIPPRDLKKETRAELWDEQEGAEIFTDPLSGETHVRGMQWWNSVTFLNCELSGITALSVWAAAPLNPYTLQIHLDGMPVAEITVPCCDGYTDFKMLTVPLITTGCHDLKLAFPQNACIRSIKAEIS